MLNDIKKIFSFL